MQYYKEELADKQIALGIFMNHFDEYTTLRKDALTKEAARIAEEERRAAEKILAEEKAAEEAAGSDISVLMEDMLHQITKSYAEEKEVATLAEFEQEFAALQVKPDDEDKQSTSGTSTDE